MKVIKKKTPIGTNRQSNVQHAETTYPFCPTILESTCIFLIVNPSTQVTRASAKYTFATKTANRTTSKCLQDGTPKIEALYLFGVASAVLTKTSTKKRGSVAAVKPVSKLVRCYVTKVDVVHRCFLLTSASVFTIP